MKNLFGLQSLLCLLYFCQIKSEPCNSNDTEEDFNALAKWANELPALQKEDEIKQKQFESADFFMMSDKQIRHQFYQFLSQPEQTVCTISKKIGGEWLPSCAWYDGAKFVCLDKFKKAIEEGKCLIYSFGLASDWSFEETLAEMGCVVRAFDPTVNKPKRVTNPNIHFTKVGLADSNGQTQVFDNEKDNRKILVPVKTLETIIKENGDEDKIITYLKVDVESSELSAIPTWTKSEILNNIDQIGIELHTGAVHLKDHKIGQVLSSILLTFKEMRQRFGFKIIDYTPNGCVGKSQDKIEKRYTTYFDIVLYKR